MRPPLIKYYTYQDEFDIHISKEFCEHHIKKIITTYSKKTIFEAISTISIKFSISNDPVHVLNVQKELLNIPIESNVFIFHRQATITIYQFLYQFEDGEYGDSEKINWKDIFLLYIIINSFLDLYETINYTISLYKKIFFGNIKNYQFTSNANDLLADYELFKDYYENIDDKDKIRYDEIIFDKINLHLTEYIAALELIRNYNHPNIFEFFENYAVVNFAETNKAWVSREPKFDIPFEIPFFQRKPLIKFNTSHFLIDANFLLNSMSRIVYESLCEYDYQGFKSNWGEIVEQVIKTRLREIFTHKECREIKVQSINNQYADFGLVSNNNIYLFEIKTSVINTTTLYTNNYHAFKKYYNDKFILKEGVCQQIKMLEKIESDYKKFCEFSKIDKNNEYTIYPILLVFDETLQAFGACHYNSTMFDILMHHRKLSPTNYDLSNHHTTITFHEIFKLKLLGKSKEELIDFVQLYANQQIKPMMSFSLFLQEQRNNTD
ncbi:hypothetical protein ACFLQT_01195 [Bacteroidota bacterium]